MTYCFTFKKIDNGTQGPLFRDIVICGYSYDTARALAEIEMAEYAKGYIIDPEDALEELGDDPYGTAVDKAWEELKEAM